MRPLLLLLLPVAGCAGHRFSVAATVGPESWVEGPRQVANERGFGWQVRLGGISESGGAGAEAEEWRQGGFYQFRFGGWFTRTLGRSAPLTPVIGLHTGLFLYDRVGEAEPFGGYYLGPQLGLELRLSRALAFMAGIAPTVSVFQEGEGTSTSMRYYVGGSIR